jgi:hypothetical protein
MYSKTEVLYLANNADVFRKILQIFTQTKVAVPLSREILTGLWPMLEQLPTGMVDALQRMPPAPLSGGQWGCGRHEGSQSGSGDYSTVTLGCSGVEDQLRQRVSEEEVNYSSGIVFTHVSCFRNKILRPLHVHVHIHYWIPELCDLICMYI